MGAWWRTLSWMNYHSFMDRDSNDPHQWSLHFPEATEEEQELWKEIARKQAGVSLFLLAPLYTGCGALFLVLRKARFRFYRYFKWLAPPTFAFWGTFWIFIYHNYSFHKKFKLAVVNNPTPYGYFANISLDHHKPDAEQIRAWKEEGVKDNEYKYE